MMSHPLDRIGEPLVSTYALGPYEKECLLLSHQKYVVLFLLRSSFVASGDMFTNNDHNAFAVPFTLPRLSLEPSLLSTATSYFTKTSRV